MHMYMTILSRIYTCIHVYIYIDKYIHTHIHILIFQNYFVHAQYRRVQRRSPRHQLYEVLGMSADSCPRYHLDEVVPSGRSPRHHLYEVLHITDRVLLTIKCMKSAAYSFSPAYAPQSTNEIAVA